MQFGKQGSWEKSSFVSVRMDSSRLLGVWAFSPSLDLDSPIPACVSSRCQDPCTWKFHIPLAHQGGKEPQKDLEKEIFIKVARDWVTTISCVWRNLPPSKLESYYLPTLLGDLIFSGWKCICWGRVWKGICLMHTCHKASYTCDTAKPFNFSASWEYVPQIKGPGPKPAENAGSLSIDCKSLWVRY